MTGYLTDLFGVPGLSGPCSLRSRWFALDLFELTLYGVVVPVEAYATYRLVGPAASA